MYERENRKIVEAEAAKIYVQLLTSFPGSTHYTLLPKTSIRIFVINKQVPNQRFLLKSIFIYILQVLKIDRLVHKESNFFSKRVHRL